MWHMICSTCGGRLFNYDADRMTCKQGHIAPRSTEPWVPLESERLVIPRWAWPATAAVIAGADALLHLLA
jgi:hypothetical protein